MPIQLLMPALSPTMTEGNLVKWLKTEGQLVKAGEVLAEIETDKATMEVEAVDEGVLAKIIVPAGTQGVRVNALIALILEEGEDATSLVDNYTQDTAPRLSASGGDSNTISVAPEVQHSSRLSSQQQGHTKLFATPLARRLAENQGIDLAFVKGSGPKGRIIKSDIESAAQQGGFIQPDSRNIKEEEGHGPDYTDLPVSAMRKVIAKRLTQAKQEIPHFYLTIDCVLDDLLALRSQVNSRLDSHKISVNDFIVRACALALRDVPAANVAWLGDVIRQYKTTDICVAVAIEGGLVTPIVKNAHIKTLKEISENVKSLAAKAKAGKLKPEEFQGGNFTISNLGMYGIKNFSAILNPPQACILAIGAGEKRAIIRDDSIQIANVMTCTLSADHRAVDGAVAALFLASFKKYMEDPLSLLI